MPVRTESVPLCFLVIGCGSIGRRHIGNLIQLNLGEIVAYDVRSDRRHEIESRFGVKVLDRLEDGWGRQPDVALIAVPTSLHVPMALQAAEHGCHLFIEKPLSDRLDGVNQLLDVIRNRKLVTLVGCNMRFHPGPSRVKRLIDEGAIGRVIAARIQTGSYLPDWRPHADYRESYSASNTQGGGALLDCIHEIDLALWYFGPGKVVAAASVPAEAIGLDVEGLMEILIRHQSGVLSSVHLNFIQRDYRRGCQIIGTEGSLYWDFEDGIIRWYRSSGEWQVFGQPDGWIASQMYVDEMTYFLRCVSDGASTFSSVEDGLAALQVALAAKDHATQRHELMSL
jgi:predicted dehydrogenase